MSRGQAGPRVHEGRESVRQGDGDAGWHHRTLAGRELDVGGRDQIRAGIAGMGALIELAVARGEIREPGLARFPQLVVAPAIVAVIWHGLFGRLAPLDAAEMFRVHFDLIFGERSAT